MTKAKSQIQKFRDAARELGADGNEERFNAKLGAVARHKLIPDSKHPASKPAKPRNKTKDA